MFKKVIIVVIIIVVALLVFGMTIGRQTINNEDPTYWEKDIKRIEQRYGEDIPNVDIVFIGSSSIRKWETLEQDMSPYKVVNHGFGGSKIADSTYYYDRLIKPFSPEAIVIFSGANDINGIKGESKTGEEVFDLFKEFFEKSQSELPNVPVYYISISPTESRWAVWNDARKANELIKEYSAEKEMLTFIDTTDALLNEEGTPNAELFERDKLHLNKKGYEVWNSIIRPVVTENLDK